MSVLCNSSLNDLNLERVARDGTFSITKTLGSIRPTHFKNSKQIDFLGLRGPFSQQQRTLGTVDLQKTQSTPLKIVRLVKKIGYVIANNVRSDIFSVCFASMFVKVICKQNFKPGVCRPKSMPPAPEKREIEEYWFFLSDICFFALVCRNGTHC